MTQYLLGALAAFIAAGGFDFAWRGWHGFALEIYAHGKAKVFRWWLVWVLLTLSVVSGLSSLLFVVAVKLIGGAPWPL